jgi:hypothetical protein
MNSDFLEPMLEHEGFQGRYSDKAHTTTPLGCAVYWRSAAFRLISEEPSLDLTRASAETSHAATRAMALWLEETPSVSEVLAKTTTVANVVLLESLGQPGRGLCVVNVHLFGDPGAPHIRLIQTALALYKSQELIEGCGVDHVSVLFCGDFNCGTQAGACELLSEGRIATAHREWQAARHFKWGSLGAKWEEESLLAFLEANGSIAAAEPGERKESFEAWHAAQGEVDVAPLALPLAHPWKLASSLAGEVEYTYIAGRHSVWMCDHIFYDATQLELCRVIPVAPKEHAREWAAPSSAFPSDHCAAVVDFRWPRGP